ncbi:O-antigen polymerase [Mesobacillus sp. LC4]
MESAVFYSVILLGSILLSLIINRSKSNDTSLGLMLLTVYFVISIFSIIIVKNNLMYLPEITFFPFIILLLSYSITFLPFFNSKNNLKVNNVEITYYKVYNYLIFLYIGFSIISIFIYLPHVAELITENNWALQRNMYYDDLADRPYNNFLERVALNYTSYFRTFAMLIFFIFLKYDYNPKLRSLLLITIVAEISLTAMQNVSRGMIFDFFILFIAMYIFFRKSLSQKNKRQIRVFFLTLGSIFLLYSIVVTISRFSESTSFDVNSMRSLIEYFGQSPLVFNYGVFPISMHTYGIYSFGRIFELFGADISYPQASIGGSWGSGFYTYVGLVFIDFGIMGVIIHALFINFVLTYLFRRNKFKVSHLFLIFTIYQYLLKGAFVIGRNYIISLVVYICIFIFLYLLERVKLDNGIKPYIDLSKKRNSKIKIK